VIRRSAPSAGVFDLDYLKPLVVSERHSKTQTSRRALNKA
jgi:hypothetical protein